MIAITIQVAKDLLGEAFHTALRKTGTSDEAVRVQQAMDRMEPDDLADVWTFALSGLAEAGIVLAKEEE